jgi:hypothetical protein
MAKPHGLSGWVDIDRPKLVSLPWPARIDWFEYRVHLVVIRPLDNILDTQVVADPDSSALLIAGMSLCAAIEASGKFITGRTDAKGNEVPNNLRFKRFVNDYMSADLTTRKIGKRSYAKVIWDDYRNGLAHGFAVRGGGFNGNRGDPYFGVNPDNTLNVNPAAFFDDYVRGFQSYVADLRAGGPQLPMFKSTFDSVFIRGE